MAGQWYVYNIDPVDHGWFLLPTINDILAKVDYQYGGEVPLDDGFPFEGHGSFRLDWEEAQRLATGAGWRGDFAGEPRVLLVPLGESFVCGFVFKQDRRGRTFVVAPVPMPWLEKF